MTVMAKDFGATGSGPTAIVSYIDAYANATHLVITYRYSGKVGIPVPTAPAAYYYIFSDPAESTAFLTEFESDDAPKYGMRIAREGYDVNEAQYIQNYQFLYPPMKIAIQGSVDITANSGTYDIATIPHHLPYRPAFRVRILGPFAPSSYKLPFTYIIDGPYSYCWIDDTNLYITFGLNLFWPGPITATVKYTIYAERSK
jgi:hypothetical protein